MKSKTGADIFEAVDYILDKSDIFNRYNVDYYLSGTGLAVNPKYCGKGLWIIPRIIKINIQKSINIIQKFLSGIATEMIKARSRMLEYLGLKVTSTGFSSIGAQKAAERAGYTTDYDIRSLNIFNKSLFVIKFIFSSI